MRWLLTTWLGSAALLEWYGRRRALDGETFDAIVVLGGRVGPDGRPGAAVRRRVERAVELFRAGAAPLIVCAGGQNHCPVSEAQAAADLASELGVPSQAIALEERSSNTAENAAYCAQLIQGSGVLLVTDTYHVFRAQRVFARYFARVAAVGCEIPRPWAHARGAVREVAAVAAYAALGKL